ncbi:hypothetical protein [Pyrobaculum ferrireducens]|uniref:Uncharacterized protein n=1 Tax=Pyrobaculum ferrireducens TaxID=1104324 RepID=G7VIA1_9CREN|nr:hypothetical protein [Pyrobaculum ferrireducens]AET32193.1 hypothetical protein P186_0745 [Pyrobaculum ferrireducens]
MKKYFFIVPLALVLIGYAFPVWTIWFNAPMYGHTWFSISVYPTGTVAGPVFEVNIMNHYVGIGKLEPEKMIELKFVPAVWALLAVFVALAWIKRNSRLGLVFWLLAVAVLVGFVAYHWYFLDKYLNTRDPMAPVKAGYVPPLVMGSDKVANIYRVAYYDVSYWLAWVAVVITAPGINRRIEKFLK